jgi:hypothetical protein
MTVDPRALLMAVQERADELIEAVTRAVDTADAVDAAYCDDCSSRVRPDEWQPREDRPFDPCPCGGDHLTIDHPSGSRLPEPTE